jgi:translation initiation factor IF-2
MNTINQKSHITIPIGNQVARPPVVVVMGHVDHGKSTLLDYIRNTNIVAKESGGITQHINAYEVKRKNEKGEERLITFLDTPGHEAFSQMRSRGAKAADIAILVVSAEDSVKAQTMEAYETIVKNNVPYIVAINKIDKPNANVEKVKMDLAEKGIYLEGMGGNITFVPISAKTGAGIDDLLDMILLTADLQEFTGQRELNASGIIIEAVCEPKRGISATCLIKNGTLKSGMFVACGTSIVSTRIMENFLGKPIKEATFSSPISLTGFDIIPEVGSIFESFKTKKEAELYVNTIKDEITLDNNEDETSSPIIGKIIPIIIKTDVSGSIEALQKEIEKLATEDVSFKIINSGVGAINESDIRMASVNDETIIIGFNVKIDNKAKDINESLGVTINLSNIIYKITDWLKEVVEERRPKTETVEVIGTLKVLKTFSSIKNKRIIGGKVTEGRITSSSEVRIMRRDFEIGRGKIIGLEHNKIKAKEVLENSDCGVLVDSKIEIANGDVLEAFILTVK